MTVPPIVNHVATGIYAALPVVLATLVDQHVISQPLSVQIGAGIAAFAAGFHGAQGVSAIAAKSSTTEPAKV